MNSEMDYLADDLDGEAPCEFCGELYPLVLLIEHQTIHLTDESYYGDLDEILNQEEVQNVISETIEAANSEVIVEQSPHSSVKNEPKIITEQKQQSAVFNQTNTNESTDSKKNLSSQINDKIVFMQPYKRRRIVSNSSSSGKSDQDFHMDESNDAKSEDDEISIIFETEASTENTTTEKKQSEIFSKTLKDIKKFPEQKNKESITEKGEKLLVLGDEIDPDKELENEKPAYKMPNNPLLNSAYKNEDIEDINNLSDDDCDESLEEFWKRARDFLKRNRVKN